MKYYESAQKTDVLYNAFGLISNFQELDKIPPSSNTNVKYFLMIYRKFAKDI